MEAYKTDKRGSIALTLLFILLSILALFPFYAMFLASFKPSTELLRFGLNVKLQPDVLSLANYEYIFTEGKRYFLWYKNSVIITVFYTVFALFFSSMVGYALAIYHFKGRNIIMVMVLLKMMIPVEIMMLPLYKLMVALKMVNTYGGVILPFAVAPVAIFFFRQYAVGLPKELLDSARIDGCSEFGIFFKIMAPLMAPAFGAMGILQAMHSWNNFLWPLIVLRTEDKFTLPIGLSGLLTPYGNNYDLLVSGSVLTVLPILILFFLFQKYFVAGLTVGGVKG